jgi:DNA invertase Pin-like site-specific DNA recombinase
MSTTVKRTAYSYVRFSSRKQEKGDSIRRQKDMSERYAEKNNMVIDQELFFDDGVSAYRGLNASNGALGNFFK